MCSELHINSYYEYRTAEFLRKGVDVKYPPNDSNNYYGHRWTARMTRRNFPSLFRPITRYFFLQANTDT